MTDCGPFLTHIVLLEEREKHFFPLHNKAALANIHHTFKLKGKELLNTYLQMKKHMLQKNWNTYSSELI